MTPDKRKLATTPNGLRLVMRSDGNGKERMCYFRLPEQLILGNTNENIVTGNATCFKTSNISYER